MYQLYNLIESKWAKSGNPFAADSRRTAINYVRAMGHARMTEKTGTHIKHLLEGTFKVVKV